MANVSYIIYNSAAATTAAPVKQPSGTAIRTMMQLAVATGYLPKVISWGISFDGSAAATPGTVELIETDVAATGLSTAYVLADVQKWQNSNSPTQTSGTSGLPFNLGTSLSGFATGAVTEGSTTVSRMADCALIAPTNQYVHDFPLGREFELIAGRFLRVRVTFGTTVNMICWVIVEF